MKKAIGLWLESFSKGLQMFRGWYVAAVTLALNIFATATVFLAIGRATAEWNWLAASIAAVALVALTAFMFIYSPYLGQLAETRKLEGALLNEQSDHAKTRRAMEPLITMQKVQRATPGYFLWVSVPKINFVPIDGQHDYFIFKLRFVNTFIETIELSSVKATIQFNNRHLPATSFSINETARKLKPNLRQDLIEYVQLFGSNLEWIEHLKNTDPTVLVDVEVVLRDGKIINFSQLPQGQETNADEENLGRVRSSQ